MKINKIPFSWGALVGKADDSILNLRKRKFEGRFLPWAQRWANAVGTTHTFKNKLIIRMGFNKGPCINMLKREVMVGYSEDDLRKPYNMFEAQCLAYLGHEMGHENFTVQSISDEIRETISADFLAQFPEIPDTEVKRMVATQMAAILVNIVEDGRIETQFAYKYPAFQKRFRNSNLSQWKAQSKMPEEDYDKWNRLSIFLSVLGAPPIWVRKLPKTDELVKLIPEMMDILDKSCDIPSMEDAKDYFYQFYEVSKEYLKNALREAMENSPKKQELLDRLRQAAADYVGTSGEGGNKGKSSGSSSGKSPRMTKSKDGGEGDGSGKGEEGAKPTPPDHTTTYDGDNDKAEEGDKPGCDRGSDEDLAIDWDALEEAAHEAELDEEASAPETTAEVEDVSLSDELSEAYSAAGDDYACTFSEIPRDGLWSPQPLPNEIAIKAKMVAKAIENIRANRSHSNPKDKGRINNRKLYRYAAKDYNIFKDKKVTKGGLAGAIAWDGSGSMSGSKQVMSGEACALVERAFNDIPLKIINFSVACKTEHYIVKDFDEKSKNLSYSYGYAKWRGFNGGNKDGYSIRVLTRQLMERPEEKKFLFILSDGLPSDYSGGFRQGKQDVHDAVEEAIKQGIEVIAIAFGSDYDRRENHSDYEFMYTKAGAKLIECAPSEIGNHLTKIMTQFSLKSK